MKQSFQFYAKCSPDLKDPQILKDLLRVGLTGLCLDLTEDSCANRELAELVFQASASMHKVPEFLLRLPAGADSDEEARTHHLISEIEPLLPFGPTGILLSGVEDQKLLIRWNKLLLARGFSQIRLAAGIGSLNGIEGLMHLLPWCKEVVLERNLLARTAPAASLPVLQKRAAALCNAGRTAFTVCDAFLASAMAGSDPSPAEVNDAAALVFDGASGIMFSQDILRAESPVPVMELVDQIVYEAMRYRHTGSGLHLN